MDNSDIGDLNENVVTRAPDMERIRNAHKKRLQQLKNWNQYDKAMDKELNRRTKKGLSPPTAMGRGHTLRGVQFSSSLVLLEAAARGDLDEVRRLLGEGVCPDAANADGLTALHQCCIDNSPEMCRLLLRFGANVNARDTELWTPLHASATCCHADICKVLIEHDADLLALNADGNMPYDICEDEITLDVIETAMANGGVAQEDIDERRCVPEREMLADMEALVKTGVDINKLDQQGGAPLHTASASGYVDVICFLLQHGASLERHDRDGWQAMHVAACWGQLDVIETLLNFGGDMDCVTTSGETIFDICEDGEIHSRLLNIRREWDLRKQQQQMQLQKRASVTRGLVRRRSSNNPRSASIRRSSMREKNMLSRKEAKQEAELLSLQVTVENNGLKECASLPDAPPPLQPRSANRVTSEISRPINGSTRTPKSQPTMSSNSSKTNSMPPPTGHMPTNSARSREAYSKPIASDIGRSGAGISQRRTTGSGFKSPPYVPPNSNQGSTGPSATMVNSRRSGHHSSADARSPLSVETQSHQRPSTTSGSGAVHSPNRIVHSRAPNGRLSDPANMPLVQHNAYYTAQTGSLPGPQPTGRWRPPASGDSRDMRQRDVFGKPRHPQQHPTSTGVVATPLAPPGTASNRHSSRVLISATPHMSPESRVGGKCCTVM